MGKIEATGTEVSVLVVDDNPLLCAGLVRLLVKAGHRARGAVSVAEAIAATRAETFDCGVFDVRLGLEDGLELANRLLADGRVRSAVFFSATLAGADRVRARRLGAFVSKSGSVECVLGAVVDIVKMASKP